NVPAGAKALGPARIGNRKTDQVAVASTLGRLLVFPLAELPVMARGKGIKLIDLSRARAAEGEERVRSVAVLPEGGGLRVVTGRRHLTLKPEDLVPYRGARARRGVLLPRGF